MDDQFDYGLLDLNLNPQSLDRDKVDQVVQDLQVLARQQRAELAKSSYLAQQQRTEIADLSDRLLVYEGELSSYNSQKWIAATEDFPEEIEGPTPSCFGQKHRLVLRYDQNKNTLEAVELSTLAKKHAIYSRLPSRWSKSINVYVGMPGATNRFTVTTKERAPSGMSRMCVIHPRKLQRMNRMRILFGQIEWLFIVRSTWHVERSNTDDSLALNKLPSPNPNVYIRDSSSSRRS